CPWPCPHCITKQDNFNLNVTDTVYANRTHFHHGLIAQIGGVTHGWFDADFHCHSNDRECIDSAVAQNDIERRALESRHRNLVENGFRWLRREFRNQLKTSCVANKPRFLLFQRFCPLPRHGHPHLEHAHELLRQRHVSREDHTNAALSRGSEDFQNARGNLRPILDLAQDSNLHIVDKKRHSSRIAK